MFPFLRISALLFGALTISHVVCADELTTAISDSSRLSALSNSPVAPQEVEIAWVYGSLSSLIWETLPRDGAIVRFFDSARAKEELSPNKRLDLAIQILRRHPDSFAKLVHADLTVKQAELRVGIQNSALERLILVLPDRLPATSARPVQSLALSRVWRDAIYQDLAAIFRTEPNIKGDEIAAMIPLFGPDNALKARAKLALTQLGDARAIALLIADEPAHPMRHWMSLSKLALQHPNDPALQTLVPLLFSPDAEVRSTAMIILPASRPDIYKMLPAWLDDPDSRARYLAVSKAFKLPENQFAPLENQLKTKLADAVENVSLAAALRFAARKNPIAVPVLLKWLRAHSEMGLTSDVSDALNQLIGFDSGYQPIHTLTPEIAQRNAEAFARIEAWIVAHPAR